MRIEHTIEIDASVGTVWELTLDIESWPQFTPTMTSVERLDTGTLSVGSKARVKQPGQRAKVWTITQIDHEEAFAWSAGVMGTTMTAVHSLEPTGAGTINVLSVNIEGGLAPLIGRLLRRPISSALAKENTGFKTAAETR